MALKRDSSIITETAIGTFIGVGNGDLIGNTDKLVQKVMVELLTEKGSKRYNREAGTTFLTALKSSTVRSEYDVINYFMVAAEDIKKKFKAEETTTTPPAEKLKELTIEKVLVAPSRVLFTIKITSEKNTTAHLTTMTRAVL